MKVIKGPREHTWRCQNCGALISSYLHEGKRCLPDKFSYDAIVIETKCPVCSEINNLQEKAFKSEEKQ